MRQNQLLDRAMRAEFARIHDTFLTIARAYAAKVQPYCAVQDGLFGYEADELEYPIRVFEVIGILGELGLALVYRMASEEEESVRQELLQECEGVGEILASMIRNNASASSPCHDGHAIDIGIGLLALSNLGPREQAAAWLKELGNRVMFAYTIGRRFPISSDSYDDLIALRFDEGFPKEQVLNLSTLVPLLADWFAVLDLVTPYEDFKDLVARTLPNANLQMWFPDEGIEEALYKANAGFRGGKTLTSILLPDKLEDLKVRVNRLMGQSVFEGLSFIEQDWPVLGIVASRHFRTPLMPEYWQQSLLPASESLGSGLSSELGDSPERVR